MTAPRSLDYFIARACERLHLQEDEFHAAGYDRQVRWLAYDWLRRQEETRPHPGGPHGRPDDTR